jgi:hypothetical protein
VKSRRGLYKKERRAKTKTTNIDIRDTQPGSHNMDVEQPTDKRAPLKSEKVKPKTRSHGNLVLGLLVVSVAICWTPDTVYYLIITFTNMDAPIYYQVATILFSCQTMLDPILFTVALKSLRQSLRRTFTC